MGKSTTICIDASIVVQLILKPGDTIIKQHWDLWLSQGYRLVAPTLLYYEVANRLYEQEMGGVLSSDFVRDSLDFALTLPIELVGDSALHQHAHELAGEYTLPTIYTAHYLALAERLGVELWTTDANLINKLKSFGIEWIMLVK